MVSTVGGLPSNICCFPPFGLEVVGFEYDDGLRCLGKNNAGTSRLDHKYGFTGPLDVVPTGPVKNFGVPVDFYLIWDAMRIENVLGLLGATLLSLTGFVMKKWLG